MRSDAERLRTLRPVAPPAWVFHSIGRRRRPFSVALAFVLLVLSGVLAAALAGSIIRLPVLMDASPSPAPRISPAAYPSVLVNTALRVTAPEIVLRQVPSTSGAEIARAGRDSLFVTDAALRIQAEGFDWYHGILVSDVQFPPPLPGSPRDGGGVSGWIAARSAGESFVSTVSPRCPSGNGLQDVAAMLEAERLACFGGATIALDGVFSCPSCGGSVAGVYEPAWLAASGSGVLLPLGSTSGPSLELHFPPGGATIPEDGSRISVRGHFDDPAAAGCHLSLPMPGEPGASISPVDIESVVLLCRQAFVVESHGVSPAR